jgi:hypothetical protein
MGREAVTSAPEATSGGEPAEESAWFESLGRDPACPSRSHPGPGETP